MRIEIISAESIHAVPLRLPRVLWPHAVLLAIAILAMTYGAIADLVGWL
jgi:hypothetical protein